MISRDPTSPEDRLLALNQGSLAFANRASENLGIWAHGAMGIRADAGFASINLEKTSVQFERGTSVGRGFRMELSFLPSIGGGYEKNIEDCWRDIRLHDLAAGNAARHRFRTSRLCKRVILVVQSTRALAKGGTRHYPSQRLVVHRQNSNDQGSNADTVSAAPLGVDLVRCI